MYNLYVLGTYLCLMKNTWNPSIFINIPADLMFFRCECVNNPKNNQMCIPPFLINSLEKYSAQNTSDCEDSVFRALSLSLNQFTKSGVITGRNLRASSIAGIIFACTPATWWI